MYRIIGGDQKEYGPVSAEQLRTWISEGRVNAQAQACAEGTSEWKPLSAFPEFAGALGPAAGPAEVQPLAATPIGADNSEREAALRAVKGPAIALAITAGLGVLYYAFSGVVTLISGGGMFQQELPADVPPQLRTFLEGMRGPLAGIGNLVVAALNGLVLVGAIKMMRLQNYALAMTASIVAMIPCQCCCLLGLPFGIWSVVMLKKPEVKQWFS
jgi:hypothetical protein